MTHYQNGEIPAPGQPGSPLTVIGSGTDSNGYWEFQISAHTLWMWNAAKAYAEKHFGKTLHIRTGWNCYRPYAVQVAARQRACAAGNCNAAASPGYSSHGGTWIDSHFTSGAWVDAIAIDVDPNGLTWAQVWEACTAAGFLCNAITLQRAGIAEPWHIIDLRPWDAIPSDVNVQPFPATTPVEEDDMLALRIHNGNTVYCATLGRGVFRHLIGSDNPEKVKNIIRSADDWQDITIQELPVYLWTYGCDLNIWDVRNGDFAIFNPLDGSVKAGGMWSAENATRAAVKGISAQTVDISDLAKQITDDFVSRLAS